MGKVGKMAQVAAKSAGAVQTGWKLVLRKWAYSASYFPQVGLMYDDTLRETPDVKEAIRRLPGDLQDARVFRISRALQLSGNKQVLPKEEWTKYDDDVQYLRPILEQVVKERKERSAWLKQ